MLREAHTEDKASLHQQSLCRRAHQYLLPVNSLEMQQKRRDHLRNIQKHVCDQEPNTTRHLLVVALFLAVHNADFLPC